ncbi:MAG: hypothetical protein IT585_07130 [candidate division Zixibacteria bacterium]|nr:hypothetical protein [candidate division Zixibacteria bacterium]
MKLQACALCDCITTLVDSHIIPEFVYRNARVYNEDHTFTAFRIDCDGHGEILGDRRNGIYEKLLCEKCESKLAGLDDYAAKAMWGGTRLGFSHGELGSTVHGIDYRRMKLFELSLLWRIAVSQRIEFDNIRLLTGHERKLRHALQTTSPLRQNDYGCALVYLINPPTVPIERAILGDQFRNQGQKCVRLVMAGFLWIFVVAAGLRYFKGSQFFLHENGTRTIPKYSSVQLIDWLASSDLIEQDAKHAE